MVEADTRELALLALRGDDSDPDGEPEAYSAVELAKRLDMGTETMADRIALFSTLSELIGEGLVETDSGFEGRVYALTEAGRERADGVHETVTERRIEVRNGTNEEIAVGEVDEYLSEPAVARALSRLRGDDVLYLEETVEEEFVDRDRERDAIARHVSRTRTGEGRVVMVTGGAGVGKTTFVEEALASEHDLQVLDGIVRADTDQPYQAVREAIEPALEQSPFDRPALELRDPDDLDRFRTALFADVANALLGLGQDGPVALFLDDLQNAGRPTLELVDALARRVQDGRVLLVLAARDGGYEKASDVQRLLDEVIDRQPHDHVELAPFDRERTRELIEATLGTRSVPTGFVDLVYDHTGGMPLFVVETCSRMQEQQVLAPRHGAYPTDADRLETSENVAATIETRLEMLDEVGERVLSMAALLGEEFAVEDLVTSTEVDETTVREYLDVLVDSDVLQVIEAEDGAHSRLRFRSALFRETVTDRRSAEQRARDHHRIATALDEQRADSPGRAATVAHHYARADDDREALAAYLEAAEHAEAVYAHELARQHYDRALSIAREFEDSEQVLDIVESVGDIAMVVGDREKARRSFEYVRERATETDRQQRAARKIARFQLEWEGDAEAALETVESALAPNGREPSTPEECRLLLVRQSAASNLGDRELARETIDTALALADSLGDRALRARAFVGLVEMRTVHDLGGIDDEVIGMGQRAIAIWEELGDDRELAEALVTLGTLYGMIGMVKESLSVSRRALELNQQLGDRVGALDSEYMMVNRLLTMALNGDHPVEAVTEQCDDLIAEAEELGNDSVLLKALATRGVLDWQASYDYESAVERLERAVDIVGGYDHWAAGHIVVALASAHRDAGEFDRTRDVLDRLLERERDSYGPKVRTTSHYLEGVLAFEAGDTEGAIDAYQRGVEVGAETGFEQGEALARAGLVDALLAAGRLEDAADQTDWIRVYLADYPDHGPYRGDEPFTQITEKPTLAARRALGRVARERGDRDTASEVFEAGLSIARDHGDSLREATFLFELAVTDHERGREEAADERAALAQSSTADLGAFGEQLDRRYAETVAR